MYQKIVIGLVTLGLLGGTAYACVQVIDQCPNIEGVQETIPEGLIKDDNGECIQPPVDLCPNLDGVQVTLPEGYQFNSDKECVVILPIVVPPVVKPPKVTPPVVQPPVVQAPVEIFQGK